MSGDGGFRGDQGVRGGSFYDDPAVFERYSEHRRGGVRSPNIVMEEPAVLAQLGAVAGLRVLDLGCGDGSFGRTLLEAGCSSYRGVDGSSRMVAHATTALRGTGGEVVLADLEDFDGSPVGYDVVLSRLALHYVEDLGAVLAGCHRSLVSGGRLVMTVVHPIITSHDVGDAACLRTSWLVDDYFVPGPRRRAWLGGTVTWFHRTVEQYVLDIGRAGFRLTALGECEPVPARFDGDIAELERRRRVPLFLLLAATRD